MRIALITLSTPTATNQKAASALPFHIIKYRNKSIIIDIWTFNINKIEDDQIVRIEKDLDATVIIMKSPKWYGFISSKIGKILRFFLQYPILKYLNLSHRQISRIVTEYDAVWIYGEDIALMAKLFMDKPVVVTTPDCEALYYHRLLSIRDGNENIWQFIKNISLFRKYLCLARSFGASDNIHYHLVGIEDCKFLSEINPQLQIKFIRHPHYDIKQQLKEIRFSSPRIKLLITGCYNIYMKQATDEFVDMLISNPEFAGMYEITFLGKMWDTVVKEIQVHGYGTNYIKYAEDYIDEISKYDILLSPITVGTGTKGKVLDAFANGLLVVGTLRALENIAVENDISCIQYDTVKQLQHILSDIPYNIMKYEKVAENGRAAVLSLHDRVAVSEEFFSLFHI